MEKVAAFHELNYKKKVEVLAQVPGVVTLMGAFSDFCNGYCIAGTGALGLRVAMSARDDNLVRVYDATKSDKKHFNLNSLKYRKEDRWANYVKAVFSILSEEGVTFPHGFDITLKGALLFCDQLTVSSAVIMGCLMAVDSALSLSLGKKELIRLSYRAATAYCAVPIRFRDLVTLLYAQKGKVLYFDLQSVSYELIDWPFTESQYGMILDPSLPPQILREELEEKRIDARLCCKELKKRLPSDYKIVLTGSCFQGIPGAKEIVGRVTGHETEIISPTLKPFDKPRFASLAGLISVQRKNLEKNEREKFGFLHKLKEKLFRRTNR